MIWVTNKCRKEINVLRNTSNYIILHAFVVNLFIFSECQQTYDMLLFTLSCVCSHSATWRSFQEVVRQSLAYQYHSKLAPSVRDVTVSLKWSLT